MPTSTFSSDNLFRAYPFVATDDSPLFPTKRIVGAKVLCGYGSYFKSFPEVALIRWEVLSQFHHVTFRLAAGNYSNSISMDIPRNTAPFTHFFSQESEDTRIRLTVGDLSDATQSFAIPSLRLEPTCILWLKHRGIRYIQVLNENRERLTEAIEKNKVLTDEHKEAYLHSPLWQQPVLIANEGLLFSEGYNCEWSTSVIENRMMVRPRTNAGTGAVREFLSLGKTMVNIMWIDEIPENTSTMKLRPDGLPPQDRVLYAFSGATGPEITAERFQTIQVRNDVDAHTVSIAVASLNGKGC